MDFHEKLKLKTEVVEDMIFSLLPRDDDALQRTILAAMDYSVRAGGKRLRPILIGEMCALFADGEGAFGTIRSGDADTMENVVPLHPALPYFLAAIECIHTYSLVHDDLPAMDNDMLRRGKPTTHAVYGEAMGILAGDALLNFAFELASAGCLRCAENGIGDGHSNDLETAVRAMAVLSKKAGVFGMVGGQVIDVEGEKAGLPMTNERLDTIYRLKTSALLEAAMMCGAILGGAAEPEIVTVERIARNVGLAFQIRDDILDVTGDEATVGKPIGSDEKNDKQTYVALNGLEKADEEVRRLTDEALRELSLLSGDTAFLTELILYLTKRQW